MSIKQLLEADINNLLLIIRDYTNNRKILDFTYSLDEDYRTYLIDEILLLKDKYVINSKTRVNLLEKEVMSEFKKIADNPLITIRGRRRGIFAPDNDVRRGISDFKITVDVTDPMLREERPFVYMNYQFSYGNSVSPLRSPDYSFIVKDFKIMKDF